MKFNLFKRKPDDWKLVYHGTASWTVNSYNPYGSNKEWKEYAQYDIYYSESRKKIKVRTSGHNPYSHSFYHTVVLEELAKLKMKYDIG